MNLPLLGHSTFVVLAVAVFTAATASADTTKMEPATNCWLRISAPEAKGATVLPVVIRTGTDGKNLRSSKIGEDGFSDWVCMPRLRSIRGSGGGRYVYQSCVFNIRKDGKYVPEATVGLEIAETPGGVPILTLPAQRVEGGAVCALFRETPLNAPQNVAWFADHLAAIEKLLGDAGYGEMDVPEGIFVTFALRRDSGRDEAIITRDKRLWAQIGRIRRMLGGSKFSWSWTYDTPPGPVDAVWHDRCRKLWKGFAARHNMPLDEVTLGDEIAFPFRSGYLTNAAFRATFEAERARIAPDLPSDFAPKDFKWNVRPETREERIVRYLTVRARNRESVAVWRASTDYVKTLVGQNVKTRCNILPWYYECGGEWQQTLNRTPDYFLMAREGAFDIPEIQGMGSYYPPAGPFANALLAPMFVAQIRELNPRGGHGAALMPFPCRCEAQAYDHVFMSALVNADASFNFYSLGFHATWWEWCDERPEKLLAVARFTHALPKAAPYLAGQRRAKANLAVLLTEASDTWLWWNDRQYGNAEMRGCTYALRFSGYRLDFLREHMVEDGFLGDYKVLWATVRHANRVVQRKILDWVKAGGTLVLTPGALVRDEADDPIDLFDVYRAESGPNVYGGEKSNEFNAKKGDTSAPPRETVVGKGRVVSFPWMPGKNFCAGSARSRQAYRDETPLKKGVEELNSVTRYGVAYWMDGDESVREKIAAVAEAGGATRQIKLSHGNIDAGVLDDGTRAFVGFANYNVGEVKGLVATFKLKKRYENVKTLDGVPVKVEWDDTTARCTFDLGDSQAVLFK